MKLYKRMDKKNNKKNIFFFFKIILLIIILYLIKKTVFIKIKNNEKKNNIKYKRIGVVGVLNEQNAGNNLVKFSMFTKLKEYGLDPTIISYTRKNQNIDFLRRTVKLKEINKSFSELKEKDYDILMVNSDQTWNNYNIESLYDHGFLRFAANWTIPKFVYAASLGIDYWRYSKVFDEKAKILLKNFKGISVRERGAVDLVEKHFGIRPLFVLDPTFLIDKKKYLDIIKDLKNDFDYNQKYLFVYILDNNDIIREYINKVREELKYKVYKVSVKQINYTENFLFGINISEAIITDSFHGTIFSIIFNKPFISFINSIRGRLRFYSLIDTFDLKKRIIFPSNKYKPNINILTEPLNINENHLKKIKDLSINYLEKNLGIIK